jgi:DNA-binding GntR family transcriptional regulator
VAGFARVVRKSLFVEVRDRFLETVQSRYQPGDRLPSEPDLAEAFGVSRPTIREVLRSLEGDGLIRRVHGVGTFVTRNEPIVSSQLDVDLGITEAVAAAHQRLGVQVLRIARKRAEREIAEPLDLPLGSMVLWIERVIKANDVPAAYGIDAIPEEILTAAGDPAYVEGSVYRFLEVECGLQLVGGLAKVTALNADRRLARLLGVHPGDALIRMDQVERTADGRPVLFSSEHYVPQILDLTVRRTRDARRRQISVAAGHPEPAPGGPMN